MSDATPSPDSAKDPSTSPAGAATDNVNAAPSATSQLNSAESTPIESAAVQSQTATAGGPINLESIRKLREAQQDTNASQQQKVVRPQPGSGEIARAGGPSKSGKENFKKNGGSGPKSKQDDSESTGERYRSNKDSAPAVAPKVPVPSLRNRSAEEDLSLEAALGDANLDDLMIGDRSLRVGRTLEDGSRHPGKVIKVHNGNVFISLGGPDEGVVSILQFAEEPAEGQPVDVLIRTFNREEGLYDLAIPGETVSVNDWDDLHEGTVVEAKIESANTGGAECLVGNVRGFIPISQLSEYRVESAADFVGQKLLCVVTEANPRRGNLVLSHRAVLERDKEAKRTERLASIQVGDQCDGTVRKITDFGAFVDIGGLDGLIHISQLSWDKVKHPSDVVTEGDAVRVRIEKIDPVSGKIGLSYRSAEDNPWNDVEGRFPNGTIVKGTVSRLANFGAFVKLATGVEGLIHISELAHRRVANVSQVLSEGQEVEVKIVSVDGDSQRIGLSLRGAQAKPEGDKQDAAAAAPEEAPRAPAVKKFQGALKGGTGSNSGGLFGLKF